MSVNTLAGTHGIEQRKAFFSSLKKMSCTIALSLVRLSTPSQGLKASLGGQDISEYARVLLSNETAPGQCRAHCNGWQIASIHDTNVWASPFFRIIGSKILRHPFEKENKEAQLKLVGAVTLGNLEETEENAQLILPGVNLDRGALRQLDENRAKIYLSSLLDA
jgi:hypothetical protein